jgi:hypothetical protein
MTDLSGLPDNSWTPASAEQLALLLAPELIPHLAELIFHSPPTGAGSHAQQVAAARLHLAATRQEKVGLVICPARLPWASLEFWLLASIPVLATAPGSVRSLLQDLVNASGPDTGGT